MSQTITCNNKLNIREYKLIGEKGHRQCNGCYFLHVKYGLYQCICPISVRYEDKIKYTLAKYEKVEKKDKNDKRI